MATGTICSPRTIVHILFGMAGDALSRRPGPALPCMAGQAGGCPVAAGQGIAGRPVIERQRLFPAVDVMAGLAGLAEPAKMRILSGVAGYAGCRNAAKMRTLPVAADTGCTGMSPQKWIVGQLVIEAGMRKTHEWKGATVMVAVADLAGLRPRIRLSMEATAAPNVCTNAGMACQTFSVLSLTGKGFVA